MPPEAMGGMDSMNDGSNMPNDGSPPAAMGGMGPMHMEMMPPEQWLVWMLQ